MNTMVIRQSRNKILGILFCGALLLAALSGCAAQKRIAPVKTDFLAGIDLEEKHKNLPFDHSWIRPGVSTKSYDKVFILPVRLDHLPPNSWRASASQIITSEKDYLYEADLLVQYLRRQLEKHLREKTGTPAAVVSSPGPRTLVVEIAIVELEFSHPVMRAASIAVPVPGAGVAVASITDPHVAFAVKVTDGATGELLAAVADRHFSPIRLIDFNKLTVTSSVREICDDWAKTVADSLNMRPGEKVTGVDRFRLLPW